ncbi:MAG: glycosyltransferase, partial [bacterium]|nr:glycosyltransferase [bacterium]
MMSLFGRARTIVRTHGYGGLTARALAKLKRIASSRIEQRARKRAWHRLVSRVRSGPVYFPRHANPTVSVVVIASQHASRAASCLNALLRQLDSLPCEVIVVASADAPQTLAYLDACSGITVASADDAHDFATRANRALAAARGRFVFFLDESTIAAPDCIGRLLAACAGNERVALVGSQLVSPDGSVACAGGILWRDGTASWFGSSAGARPHSTLFPRDVDFAAPYALMARTETLRAL